jgi:tetratricopeptide (TPR) repeat protein
LHRKWKYAETIACFDKAAELNNCQAQAHFWRGLAEIQTENYYRAFFI